MTGAIVTHSCSDFIAKADVDEIHQTLTNDTFPWYIIGSNVGSDENVPSQRSKRIHYPDGSLYELPLRDAPFLTHFALKDYRQSPYWDMALSIFDAFCAKTGCEYRSILRARINLDFPRQIKSISPWHLDYRFPHKSFLYYVNDSDGDTLIYQERLGTEAEDRTIASVVKPQAGKAIAFDGLHYHSSGAPYDSDYRIAINICYV